MWPVNAADLFAALRGIPHLPDAQCVGLWAAFDPPEQGEQPEETEYRYKTALNVCARCPALSRCSDWLDSLPRSRRPHGVVAGRVIREPQRAAS